MIEFHKSKYHRSFDVQATGKIAESMFVQLMKTKQVPEEDVQEMLEGEEK